MLDGDAEAWKPGKLTHRQARSEQGLHSSRMSVPERLAAAAELTRRMYRIRGSISMNPKQISLRAAFAAAKVDFGGVAVIAHGYLRTTRDLEIFIRPTQDNASAAFETAEGSCRCRRA